MSYELASEILYQGPPNAIFQLIPEWVTTPFRDEEHWIAENLDIWISGDPLFLLRPQLGSLGGTAGLRRVAWIAWSAAYEVASSVLPRVEDISNTETGTITHPLQRAEVRNQPAIPLFIELFIEALADPIESEDIWDQIQLLVARTQRNDSWFDNIYFFREYTIDAALWRALLDLEASIPWALESIERRIRLGDIPLGNRAGNRGRPASRLIYSVKSSITAIDLTYAGAPFRFIHYEEIPTSRISDERHWMQLILWARWWNEVQRRLPIRDITQGDIIE